VTVSDDEMSYNKQPFRPSSLTAPKWVISTVSSEGSILRVLTDFVLWKKEEKWQRVPEELRESGIN